MGRSAAVATTGLEGRPVVGRLMNAARRDSRLPSRLAPLGLN